MLFLYSRTSSYLSNLFDFSYNRIHILLSADEDEKDDDDDVLVKIIIIVTTFFFKIL